MLVIPKEARGYAVIIPKKVIRLSSTRHRIKRQILEVLRTLPLPPALIVFPRSSVDSVNYQDIAIELQNILSNPHL